MRGQLFQDVIQKGEADLYILIHKKMHTVMTLDALLAGGELVVNPKVISF